MKVCRLYDARRVFDRAERHWGELSLLDSPTTAGLIEIRKLLTSLRDEIDNVLSELSAEIEDQEWLGF